MAQDDMYVVMYKMLAYLYDCMKKGLEPQTSRIAHDSDMIAIDYQYWTRIMYELVQHGYLDGVTVSKTWGPDLIVSVQNPVVTMEGVEFMQENSKMQKALKFLQDAKSALPFL